MLGYWNWLSGEEGRTKRDDKLEVRQNPNGAFGNPGGGPRQAWRVGEVQNITFDTIFESYNIALWQQNRGGGGATLGPVLFQLGRGQPKTTSFIWTVQTYKFDLDVSDLFLLWMFNGSDASTQGQRLPSVSSAYFHILPEKKQDTTTTRSSTSTSTSASTASTGTGTGTSITSPTGDPASVTGANLPPDNTSVPAAANNGNQNTVAMAVGVSLGVLGAAMLIGLLVWQLRKRKRKATQAGPVHEADGDATFHYNNGYPNNYYTAPAGPPVEAQATPVEVKPAWAAQYNQQEVYSNIYGQHMSQYHATYNDPRGPPNPTELGTERGPAELN